MESIALQSYGFPDEPLLRDTFPEYRCLVWRPAFPAIVIGRGNRAESSVFLDRAAADGIPVFQRPTGGEAVVLSPATLVISARKIGADQPSSRSIFHRFNERVVAALTRMGAVGLSLRGISDIAIDGRKILGSSMYRNRERVYYHAVLNVAEPADSMERYLRPPARQPDYRAGRSHREFVTSLRAAGYPLDPERLQAELQRDLSGPA